MTLLLTEGSHRASSSKAVRQVEKHTTQRAEDDEGIRPLKDKSIKDSAVERITKGAFIIFFSKFGTSTGNFVHNYGCNIDFKP